MEHDLGSASQLITKEAMRHGTANAIADAISFRLRKVPGANIRTAVFYDPSNAGYVVEAEKSGRPLFDPKPQVLRITLPEKDVHDNADSTSNWNNWMDYLARSFVRQFLPTQRSTTNLTTSTGTGSITNVTYGNTSLTGNGNVAGGINFEYVTPEENFNRSAKYAFEAALLQDTTARLEQEQEILAAEASIAESLKRLDQAE